MPANTDNQPLVYTKRQPPDRPRLQNFAVPAVPSPNRRAGSHSHSASNRSGTDVQNRQQAFVNRKDSLVGRGSKVRRYDREMIPEHGGSYETDETHVTGADVKGLGNDDEGGVSGWDCDFRDEGTA
jgi:hypothetical protein